MEARYRFAQFHCYQCETSFSADYRAIQVLACTNCGSTFVQELERSSSEQQFAYNFDVSSDEESEPDYLNSPERPQLSSGPSSHAYSQVFRPGQERVQVRPTQCADESNVTPPLGQRMRQRQPQSFFRSIGQQQVSNSRQRRNIPQVQLRRRPRLHADNQYGSNPDLDPVRHEDIYQRGVYPNLTRNVDLYPQPGYNEHFPMHGGRRLPGQRPVYPQGNVLMPRNGQRRRHRNQNHVDIHRQQPIHEAQRLHRSQVVGENSNVPYEDLNEPAFALPTWNSGYRTIQPSDLEQPSLYGTSGPFLDLIDSQMPAGLVTNPMSQFESLFSSFGIPFSHRQASLLEVLMGSLPSIPTFFTAHRAEPVFQNVASFEDLLQYIQERDPNRQGPPPATAATIAQLHTAPYQPALTQASDGSQAEPEKCSVCQDEYAAGENVITLHCQHIFHPDCIKPWLQIHNTCPVCREVVR